MFSHLSAEFFLYADPMQVLVDPIIYLDLPEFNENLYLGSRGMCLTHI